MSKPTREQLIRRYRESVERNEGRVIGERVFIGETGYSHHLWKGGFWATWSAFVEDAGYKPNLPSKKTPDEVLLRFYAELAIDLGTLPTEPEMRLHRKQDPSFPSHSAYRRWGSRDAMLDKVREFCEEHEDLESFLGIFNDGVSPKIEASLASNRVKGFVYMLRSGKSYKIGRSNAAGRRLRELAIQLPQKPDTVHVIETDDPEGIEQYWHRRFAEKRQEGEWFVLTTADVKAFKRRKYQ